jgi:DNA-directed RNA polymerase subunit M/transcription elongation factor TFIIS
MCRLEKIDCPEKYIDTIYHPIAAMNFCEKCDNMYYINISDEDDNKLMYYCRCCGNKKTNDDTTTNYILSDTNYNNNYEYIHNPFLKYDPTLPRTTIIKCPNPDCQSNLNKDTKNEVIFVRYNDADLKYMYVCTSCDIFWK